MLWYDTVLYYVTLQCVLGILLCGLVYYSILMDCPVGSRCVSVRWRTRGEDNNISVRTLAEGSNACAARSEAVLRHVWRGVRPYNKQLWLGIKMHTGAYE